VIVECVRVADGLRKPFRRGRKVGWLLYEFRGFDGSPVPLGELIVPKYGPAQITDANVPQKRMRVEG
jgi:hypothetical protein